MREEERGSEAAGRQIAYRCISSCAPLGMSVTQANRAHRYRMCKLGRACVCTPMRALTALGDAWFYASIFWAVWYILVHQWPPNRSRQSFNNTVKSGTSNITLFKRLSDTPVKIFLNSEIPWNGDLRRWKYHTFCKCVWFRGLISSLIWWHHKHPFTLFTIVKSVSLNIIYFALFCMSLNKNIIKRKILNNM